MLFSKNAKLSVEEATGELYKRLENLTQFKYLKSQRCLKKTVGDLVFELQFHTNKYNKSYEYIGVECDFCLWYKKYGKECNVNTIVAGYSYRSNVFWFDISTKKDLDRTYATLAKEITDTMLLIYREFESDYENAALQLFNIYFEKYHVYLDFIADTLGTSVIRDKAREIYSQIPEEDLVTYSDRTKGQGKMWMSNRSNEKYIIDNHLFE